MKEKKDEIVDDVADDEVSEKECFRFEGYRISADKRQYILSVPTGSRDLRTGHENFTDRTYHRTMADCLEEIYDRGMKNAALGKKTLEAALKSLQQFHDEYLKKMEPLKYLEEGENLWKGPKKTGRG